MSVALSQKQRVARLYRHSLKTCLNWAIHRDIFYDEALRIRGLFESKSSLRDKPAIERAIKSGEAELWKYAHPDPYIPPYYYGGSMYARNPPFPEGIHQQLDFGREDS